MDLLRELIETASLLEVDASVSQRVQARKKRFSEDKREFLEGFNDGLKHKAPAKKFEAYMAGHKAGIELVSQHYSPTRGWVTESQELIEEASDLTKRVDPDLTNEYMHKKPGSWSDIDDPDKSRGKVPLKKLKKVFGKDLKRRSFTVKQLWGERPESPMTDFAPTFKRFKEPIVVVSEKGTPLYVIHTGGFNYPRFMAAVQS